MTFSLAPADRFAIRDEATGEFFYYVPFDLVRNSSYRDGFALHADGHPMQRLSSGSNWWRCPVWASTLTASWTPAPTVTAYRLHDPATESQAFPASLLPEQWYELRTKYRDAADDLYEPVTEERPRESETLPGGPWRVLEGQAPPVDGDDRWIVNLPQALAHHPEFRWWLPGKLTGLRNAVAKAVRKLPNVTDVHWYNDSGPVRVVLTLPFERPLTREQTHSPTTGRKLRRPVSEEVTARIHLNLTIPDAVTGENYERALVAWQEEVGYWTGVITQHAQVSACNTCGGHGYVPTDPTPHAEAPSPRRNR
ncbi:hypothetical protein ACIQF6_28830 [Kitasatospora sp. NPDC092948]|uniref:hypothetical protein n=1 Tax=Kitasatospora sp. NPDC092948 TaxID=3364088 RepID=UPI0038013294